MREPIGAGHGPLQEREDQPIEIGRHIGALRRSIRLMALIVVPLTATVLVASILLPKSYEATATLVVREQPGLLQSSDAESTSRRMATFQELLTSREVLNGAAGDLRGETADTLRKKVSVSTSDTADILTVEATDSTPEGAAEIATGVTRTFLAGVRDQQVRQLDSARRDLEATLQRLQRSGGSDVEIQAIRQQLSQLSIDQVSAGQSLQLAEAARAPKAPSSPKPLQNTLFAFFAAIFLAVLVALARDRVSPRVTTAREFSRLTGVRPLAVLPDLGNEGDAFQTYQALQTAIAIAAGEHGQVVSIAGVVSGDDRATVSAGLAQALASSGTITVAVATDLESAGLTDRLGVPKRPGLAEALADEHPAERAVGALRQARDELAVLPPGVRGHRPPAALLGGRAFADVLGALRDESEVVLLDTPGLLLGIEGRLVGARADALIVVARLNEVSPSDAEDLRNALDEIGVPVLGAVLLGSHGRPSYSLGPGAHPRRGTGLAAVA